MIRDGYIYTFEGNEGCGKTTVINELAKKLTSEGYEVLITREPGGSELAEKIRNMIMKEEKLNTSTELMLFLAARLDHFNKVILPALKENKIVLIDRFIDSTLVYQGMVPENACNIRMIYKFNQIYFGGVYPNSIRYSFYLRLNNVEEGLKRISNNARKTNKFDNKNLEFHKKVQQAYDELYMPKVQINRDGTRVVVNASNSIEEVVNDIYKAMSKY